MFQPNQTLRYALLLILGALQLSNASSGLVSVDASALTLTPQTGVLQLGSAAAGIAPSGNTLTINSQSLVLNNKSWVPVMGEFHYSRYPADQWLPELLKMKAAGVDIVSSYIIWIHHQEVQNNTIFSGNKNITRFLQAATDAGLSVVARLGPYVHAEVRNGGLPDWVLAKSARIRSNDPIYMGFVTSFWTKIAQRINGSIFKHGGPIIGVQLENEYNLGSTGQGAAHIARLKVLAISLGLHVPLYTCTGWQGAHYPADQVVPVFGGYQDAPWDTTLEDEPPNETYSFCFFSREAGLDGNPDNASDDPNTLSELAAYPFLTAEYGAGAASMYRRRVVMNLPYDIAATIPVQIGSGFNLYGYYMFHGGVNPTGQTETLQESTASGSYNDLLVLNYDYQSPLGQYGQQRATLNRIKQYHYWLNDFGSQIAGMSLRQPAFISDGSTDLSSLRWSVRSNGKSGYLFVNNYVRQYSMAAQSNIQFAVQFSSTSGNFSSSNVTVTVPNAPVTIPNGSYFIWPLNLSLGTAKIVYATAQLVTSLNALGQKSLNALGQNVYIFMATESFAIEFAFDPKTVSRLTSIAGNVTSDATGHTLVSSITPGINVAIQVTDSSGENINIIVLNQTTTDKLWHVTTSGQEALILTDQALGLTSRGFELTNSDSPSFSFATFPAIGISSPTGPLYRAMPTGVFTQYTGCKQSRALSVTTTRLQVPGIAPPILKGGEAGGALEP